LLSLEPSSTFWSCDLAATKYDDRLKTESAMSWNWSCEINNKDLDCITTIRAHKFVSSQNQLEICFPFSIRSIFPVFKTTLLFIKRYISISLFANSQFWNTLCAYLALKVQNIIYAGEKKHSYLDEIKEKLGN